MSTVLNSNVTDAGLLKLTAAELLYLEQFLKRNDRGGYYMALYNMTGNDQALEQAQVATFSESTGGTAFVSNYLLQNNFSSQGMYPGVYYLSQKVAEESLLWMRQRLRQK